MDAELEQKVKIFYAYARKDKELRDRLAKHLKRSRYIEDWYDCEILPGEDWEERIEEKLRTAHIILLLISADFLASHYCYNIEMRRALERHKARKARVIPVILRPVIWEDQPFSRLQVLPTGGIPVTEWSNQEKAFVDIARGIHKVIKRFLEDCKTHTLHNSEVSASRHVPSLAQDLSLTHTKSVSNIWLRLLLTVTSILIAALLLFLLVPQFLPQPHPIYPRGIGVSLDENGENIGLSDGSYALDVGNERPGSLYKSQASDALRKGDIGAATALWAQALSIDSNDAEASIYREDQRISSQPHVTIVVGTELTSKPVDYTSRDQLQGACIAQLEHNKKVPTEGGLSLRLLIAKSGKNPFNSIKVANQIVEAAKSDKTIIGVLGWGTTKASLDVLKVFKDAQLHLPLLSSSSAGDDLINSSPFFFRVTSLNKEGAHVLAKYAKEGLKLQKLVFVYEYQDTFSQNFVDDFAQEFVSDGHQILIQPKYKHGSNNDEITQIVQQVLDKHPDGVLLVGSRATDIANLLQAISKKSNVKILTTGAQYASADAPLGEYDMPDFTFVSSGVPGEWQNIKSSEHVRPPDYISAFFDDYKLQFDRMRAHENAYGYQQPDSFVMLAYDAMITLLKGIEIASKTGKNALTGDDLQLALLQIDKDHPVQGVAGQISFGADHDPVNKETIVLEATKGRNFNLKYYEGCFLVGDTDCGGHLVDGF